MNIDISHDIEKITNEFFDKNAIKQEPVELIRINTKHGRKYIIHEIGEDEIPVKKIVPSVTTVIKTQSPTPFGISTWRGNIGNDKANWIYKYSAHYGTYLHIKFSGILKGKDISLNKDELKIDILHFCENNNIDFKELSKFIEEKKRDIRNDLVGFVQWIQDREVAPRAIETAIYNDKYATVIDLVCELTWNKKRHNAIVDFKSGVNGFYMDHEIQLFACMEAWNKQYDFNVDMIFNYGSKNFNIPIGTSILPYNFKNQTGSKYKHRWNHYLEMYHEEITDNETIKIDYYDDVSLNMKSDINNLYGEIDLSQQVLNIDEEKELF